MNTIIVDTGEINTVVKELDGIVEKLDIQYKSINNSLLLLSNAWFGKDADDFISSILNNSLPNYQKIIDKIVEYNQVLTEIATLYDDLDTTFVAKSCSLW